MPGLPKPFSPRDGRQSGTAVFVARGTRRLFRRLNFSTVTELPLLSGRRADIVALAMDATIFIVEIKSSIADFRADSKWRDYRPHCDRLFFAIPETVPIEIMPEDAELILADAYRAEILRQAPKHRIARRQPLLTSNRQISKPDKNEEKSSCDQAIAPCII